MKIIISALLNLLLLNSTFAAPQQLNANNLSSTFDYKNQPVVFWKKHLAPSVFDICRLSDTEPSGSGKYDHFYENGTYYCACCGGDHALYSSAAKFNSGTGWPSFYAPLPKAIVERPDSSSKIRSLIGITRTEVVCERCESHLGHVFDDGPQPTGKRYCMNSLTLTFVPEGEQPTRIFAVE